MAVRGRREPTRPPSPGDDHSETPDGSPRDDPLGLGEDVPSPPLVDGVAADAEELLDLDESDEVETMIRWAGG